MLVLVLTVVIGTLFAIFATQNTESIPLDFGRYSVPNIPLYLVVLTPLLIGLAVAFFIHTAKELSQSLTNSELKEKNKKLEEELAEITKRAHKLELENTRLRAENGEPEDENSI